MNDLKPCPFCGFYPQESRCRARCSNDDCPLSKHWMTIPAWNKRTAPNPLEDAVRKMCEEMRSYAPGSIYSGAVWPGTVARWAAALERAMEAERE